MPNQQSNCLVYITVKSFNQMQRTWDAHINTGTKEKLEDPSYKEPSDYFPAFLLVKAEAVMHVQGG